jgi:hypothetical protein
VKTPLPLSAGATGPVIPGDGDVTAFVTVERIIVRESRCSARVGAGALTARVGRDQVVCRAAPGSPGRRAPAASRCGTDRVAGRERRRPASRAGERRWRDRKRLPRTGCPAHRLRRAGSRGSRTGERATTPRSAAAAPSWPHPLPGRTVDEDGVTTSSDAAKRLRWSVGGRPGIPWRPSGEGHLPPCEGGRHLRPGVARRSASGLGVGAAPPGDTMGPGSEVGAGTVRHTAQAQRLPPEVVIRRGRNSHHELCPDRAWVKFRRRVSRAAHIRAAPVPPGWGSRRWRA